MYIEADIYKYTDVYVQERKNIDTGIKWAKIKTKPRAKERKRDR